MQFICQCDHKKSVRTFRSYWQKIKVPFLRLTVQIYANCMCRMLLGLYGGAINEWLMLTPMAIELYRSHAALLRHHFMQRTIARLRTRHVTLRGLDFNPCNLDSHKAAFAMYRYGKGKGRYSSWTPSQSYGTSLAMVLPATRHKWTHPALTPAWQRPVLDLPTPAGWKAELT